MNKRALAIAVVAFALASAAQAKTAISIDSAADASFCFKNGGSRPSLMANGTSALPRHQERGAPRSTFRFTIWEMPPCAP